MKLRSILFAALFVAGTAQAAEPLPFVKEACTAVAPTEYETCLRIGGKVIQYGRDKQEARRAAAEWQKSGRGAIYPNMMKPSAPLSILSAMQPVIVQTTREPPLAVGYYTRFHPV